MKKIYRSETDVMIGGVASGLGEYLEVDTTIVRLIWASLVLFGGTGLLLYIMMWIIIPVKSKLMDSAETNIENNVEELKKKTEETVKNIKNKNSGIGITILGLIIVFWGVYAFLNSLGVWDNIKNLFNFIPVMASFSGIALVIIGFILILNNKNK